MFHSLLCWHVWSMTLCKAKEASRHETLNIWITKFHLHRSSLTNWFIEHWVLHTEFRKSRNVNDPGKNLLEWPNFEAFYSTCYAIAIRLVFPWSSPSFKMQIWKSFSSQDTKYCIGYNGQFSLLFPSWINNFWISPQPAYLQGVPACSVGLTLSLYL